jgi:uncharacterized protein YdeI (YjbR/CyaY-like superfamily)
MTARKPRPLRRPRYVMPADIRRELLARGVMTKYRQRPAYQRNDYLGWIRRAKRPATRQKRLTQMLAELKTGDRYMKMPYRASRRRRES